MDYFYAINITISTNQLGIIFSDVAKIISHMNMKPNILGKKIILSLEI